LSELTRETGETRVRVTLDAGPDIQVSTGDEFLDHMLITLARYAGWSLGIDARGDLRHHLIEDVAITLGRVAGTDTPPTCVRYAEATVPMDEALVQVAIDAGGRPHYEGPLPSTLYDHFFRSFAMNADWTVHVRVVRGTDPHHVVEAAFKALGLAIRSAMRDEGAVFSTKGSVRMKWSEALDEARELGETTDPRPAGSKEAPTGEKGTGDGHAR
jgi:imidazoleglycerol-phosphate dehydratase